MKRAKWKYLSIDLSQMIVVGGLGFQIFMHLVKGWNKATTYLIGLLYILYNLILTQNELFYAQGHNLKKCLHLIVLLSVYQKCRRLVGWIRFKDWTEWLDIIFKNALYVWIIFGYEKSSFVDISKTRNSQYL